jgi:hypothetical protein
MAASKKLDHPGDESGQTASPNTSYLNGTSPLRLNSKWDDLP